MICDISNSGKELYTRRIYTMAEPKGTANVPDKEPREGPRPEPEYRWFTPVPQKWFALVVRGGDLYKIIHGVRGWRVDKNFYFQEEDDENPNIVSITRATFGVDFVGIPGIQGLFKYNFAWNKYWRKTDEEGNEIPEYDVVAHNPENIIFTPFESQYPLRFGGIEVIAKGKNEETKKELTPAANTEEESEKINKTEEALIPVAIDITVRVRMTRPETALMTNIDWLGGVLVPNLQKGIKDFAGEKTYDDLIRGSKRTITGELVKYIMGTEKKPSKFKKGILEHAGVEIIDIGVTGIKPNKEFEDALLNLAEAQRKALANIKLAEGKKKEARLEGEGEAARILAIAGAEKQRIEMTTLLVAGGAGANATTIEKWRQIHGSGVSTLVEAGAQASILVGANGKPISNQ